MQKNQKGFSIIEIIIVLAVIGLIGLLGWLYISKQNQANTPVSVDAQATIQPEDITAKIKDSYASKYKLLNIDENNQPKEGEMSIRLSKFAPPYKTEGYAYYTDYDGGSAIDLVAGPVNLADDPIPRQSDITIRTDVASTYKEFGLSKTGSYGAREDSIQTDIYTGKGLICTIEEPTAATSSTGASCGRIDAYKTMAEKIQPLANVMPGVDQSTILRGLKTSDSKVSGYQTAEVAQGSVEGGGGSIALFYKKGDNSWSYFMNAQNSLNCSQFTTEDLRNAYKGHECFDASGESATVQ